MLYHYAKVFSAREVVGLTESLSQVSFSSFLPKYHAYPKQKSLLHAKRSVQGTRCMRIKTSNPRYQQYWLAVCCTARLEGYCHRIARTCHQILLALLCDCVDLISWLGFAPLE